MGLTMLKALSSYINHHKDTLLLFYLGKKKTNESVSSLFAASMIPNFML